MKNQISKYVRHLLFFLIFSGLLFGSWSKSEAIPIIVNVDSRINGDIGLGFPSVDISLDAGSWLLTPTNPSIDSDALFTAWSPWSSGIWSSAVRADTSSL